MIHVTMLAVEPLGEEPGKTLVQLSHLKEERRLETQDFLTESFL